MISDKIIDGDGATTVFSVGFRIISDDHIKVFQTPLGGTEFTTSRDDYTIINNSVVFDTAPSADTTLTIQVSTDAGDLLFSPTSVGTVAESIGDVEVVADHVEHIQVVSEDLGVGAVTHVDYGDLTSTTGTPSSTSSIHNVYTNLGDINTIATPSNLAHVQNLAGNITDVTTLAPHATAIGTLATTDNLDAVLGVKAALGSVQAIDLALSSGTLALLGTQSAIADMNTLGSTGVVANMNTVATNIADVGTVATDIAKVIKVADDLNEAISEIETAADDLNEATSEIDTVATNIADVNTVGTNITDVTAVAGNSTNINTVSTNMTAITTVNTNLTNINAVNSNITNINAAVTNATNINTVAGGIANINTVAGNTTNINTVAGNTTNINAVNSNSSNINAVNTNATNINTVATNIASINNFGDTYSVSASAPSTNLNTGDLYFDTTTNTMKVYGSSGWQAAGSSVNGTARRQSFTATANQTTFTVTGGFDSGFVDVYMDGVKLHTSDFTDSSGTSIVLASGASVGQLIDIIAYGTFTLANLTVADITDVTATATELNTLDGVNATLTAVELNLLDGVTATTVELNHVDGVTSAIQSQLNGKVDDGQVLTNVPNGALFTDTVYSKPSAEPISYITGLQTALDGKVDDGQVLTNVPSGALFTDTNTDTKWDGGTTGLNAATGRTSLGLEIGTHVQAYDSTIVVDADIGSTVGYLNVPKSGASKTSSYTLATTDIGELIEVGSSGSITIPNSTFSTGDVILIFNNTTGDVTLTCSITTAYIGGTDTDKASMTLATRGICNVLFISGTVCVVTGNVS
jgi:hypothetical protein